MAGVGLIINPAIDLDSCRRVLALAEQHSSVYAALGVHPNDCADFDDGTVVQLRELAQHPKVVAIGEIGLDYYWNKVAVEQQRRALRAQLALAAELNLPVILHSRSAQGDQSRRCNTDLLQEVEDQALLSQQPIGTVHPKGGSRSSIVGVWHAFSGDLVQAERAYDRGPDVGSGRPGDFSECQRPASVDAAASA